MPDEKILTLHPMGKVGKNITVKRYEAIKGAIVANLKRSEMTHTDLINKIYEDLKDSFDGNVHWYGETVKLDLEAREVIERTTSKPPMYRLKAES